MDKGKMGTVTIGITIAILIAVFLFITFASINRDRPKIVLPDENLSSDLSNSENREELEGYVSRVEVTPQTVQNVIATLNRPESYMRALSIKTYWSGGEGTTDIETYVSGDYVRLDMTFTGGQTRHIIYAPDQTYIWYNRETTVYTANTGNFSADEEQWIPTYEDLLEIDAAHISDAGYVTYQEVDCIYAATSEDDTGYIERYWVSVDTGLLIAAEKVKDEATVYLMEAPNVTIGEPDEERYTLPDGTVLYQSKGER